MHHTVAPQHIAWIIEANTHCVIINCLLVELLAAAAAAVVMV